MLLWLFWSTYLCIDGIISSVDVIVAITASVAIAFCCHYGGSYVWVSSLGKRRALVPPSVGYVNENLKPVPEEVRYAVIKANFNVNDKYIHI